MYLIDLFRVGDIISVICDIKLTNQFIITTTVLNSTLIFFH